MYYWRNKNTPIHQVIRGLIVIVVVYFCYLLITIVIVNVS